MFILLLGELRGVPIVGAAQKDRRLVLFGLFRGKKIGVRLALAGLRSGAGGVELGIINGVDGMRFTGMPLAPSGGIDVATHFRVHENHSRIRAPGPAKEDGFGYAVINKQLAVIEDIAGIFIGIVPGLRS